MSKRLIRIIAGGVILAVAEELERKLGYSKAVAHK